jgi:flagellar motor protein MotB
MISRRYTLLVGVWLVSASATAQLVRETPLGDSSERHLSSDQTFMQWVQDPSLLKTDASDKIETHDVVEQKPETVKLTNVVPPIHFASGVAQISPDYVARLRSILDKLKDKRNLRLHLVGHADDQPLSPALALVYGDNEGLSKERAGEVAEYFQTALDLPAESISYEWAGDTKPVASNDTEEGRALNRRVEVEVWYDELKETVAQQQVVVGEPTKRVKVCRVETVCKLTYREGQERRTRIQNLVPPLHYDQDAVDVPDTFIEQVREALHNLSDKHNVVVKFIGYGDNLPLTGRAERIYGTQERLSKARAVRVALAVQGALHLPSEAIQSEGRGAARPLGSNDTAQGRALNRRIEVEFWYDDPLQELPDEPQMCPNASGVETVTKVYTPSWGTIDPLRLDHGNAVIPPGYTDTLHRAMADMVGKKNVRLRFVGYTKNEPLDRRTALVYGDDVGLSADRARRAMEEIGREMQLKPEQLEFEGRGYVQSDDVVNAGFTQTGDSHVVVQVVYDEAAELDTYDGVDITQLSKDLTPKNPLALNVMRITVDGEPIDDPERSSADIQRCTDVALDQAHIQFGFDDLKSRPRLSVTADPPTLVVHRGASDEQPIAPPVRFKMYDNYSHFIHQAEVRIFERGESPQAVPLAIVQIGADGYGEWQPEIGRFAAPARELRYVLRAYGENGAFDETSPQPLWLTYDDAPDGSGPPSGDADAAEKSSAPAILDTVAAGLSEAPRASSPPTATGADGGTSAGDGGTAAGNGGTPGPAQLTSQLLAAYGENGLAVQNIPLSSGTVTVRGSSIPPGHSVWVAGRRVPVDAQGNFVAEEILPTGAHTVEVSVLDSAGNGEDYLRDLQIKPKDWFYVGMADLTLSHDDTTGPAQLLQGDNAKYPLDSSADARLAFYVNGKFSEHWKLSASADTQDGPLKDLFSNFLDKSPDSLFRRIDPDYYYPTFGDDGTVEDAAPTLGKFYVRVDHNDNYGLWGNFKIGYLDNELAQIDRGLYGANLHYQSTSATTFGAARFAIDGFTAEPGTVSSREEFRGTGGSLYYLHRQDILQGSERVRVELRDKASGIVTGVVNLKPGLDYDIDYLQGRLLLTEPLNATVDDNLLVRSGSASGDEAYLVVRYEYTPGFADLSAVATGAQTHFWLGEHVRLGLTASDNQDGDTASSLNGADLTLRMSAASWVKLQNGKSEGLLGTTLYSNDGGFGFSGYDDSAFTDAAAAASRADVSVGLGDFRKGNKGRVNVYTQKTDAGYSAPGFATLTDTETYGGSFQMPVSDKVALHAKTDIRIQEQGLETQARELDVAYKVTDKWEMKTGFRNDFRRDSSPIVPLTQEQGERTDGVVQVGYDSGGRWRGYTFLQDTLSADGNRPDNGRMGVGGTVRLSDRLHIDAEISNGDLGQGGKFGTRYMPSDRTSLYLNYSLDNETAQNGWLQSERGAVGSLVAGVKTRLSDSTSVYVEERQQGTDTMSGLTHSAGITLAPTARLNFGATTDIGTLMDQQTGAQTKRRAGGFRLGYGSDAVQVSGGIEYRNDESEQPDTTWTERQTWLFRTNFKYQPTPDWRLIGKLNLSDSQSSLGAFYDGNFAEAVIGFAVRPIHHDRFNILTKYTYFYNVPTTDQLTLQNTAAEFVQKSHISSVDVTYDIGRLWSVGGKYAYRRGQMSLDRTDPQFFENDAHLYVVRADFKFKGDWEGLVETRLLDLPDAGDRRAGNLITVSRYVNRHVKVGVGYNFTDFSDDLTDLSFNSRGVFVNVTGAL